MDAGKSTALHVPAKFTQLLLLLYAFWPAAIVDRIKNTSCTYVSVQRHVYVQHYRTSSARNTLQLLRISNKNVSFVSAVTVTLITNRYHRLERKMWHTKSKGTFYMQIRMRSVTTDNILMRCGVVSNIGNDNRWFTGSPAL